MKKILLSAACFFAWHFFTHAQTLYGLTGNGGADGGGALIKLVTASNNLSVARSFESSAYTPQSGLIRASNGKMYGTTFYGGSYGNGIIFSFDPSSSTYTKLKNFDGIDGANPGGLMQAGDGKLYGTAGGGTNGKGVIFSFDPFTTSYTKLMEFDGTNGFGPAGSLVQATDGKLYGMTSGGGSSNYGVIFSYNPSTSTFTKLMDFGGANGANPTGSLVQANDGKLYGMTAIGGKYMYYHYNKRKDIEEYNDGYGVIFSFNPINTAYKKLVDLDVGNGANPQGSLMLADNGKLYGTTSGGGSNGSGVIFSCTPSAQANYTKLYSFDGTNGANPWGKLLQSGNGKLYGTAYGGGSGGYGVIFSYDPNSSVYIKLMDFNGTNGAHPLGNLIQGSNGKLYGTAEGGYGGIIFSYDPNITAFTRLVDLGYTNGTHPSGTLTQAGDGKLYGGTSAGGSSYFGVIFSFDPSTSIYTKLKDFDGINGNNTNSGCYLLQASDGKLYGTTGGGSSGNGVIFSFDPSSSTYTKLMDFAGTNGAGPGSVIQLNNGKLYGTTFHGGSNDGGVIFSYDPSTSAYTYTNLNDSGFINNGTNPTGGLVQSNNGKLYGMTSGGGNSNFGVIFSFDPSTSTYKKLTDFGQYNNMTQRPTGGLVQAGNGKLYGMSALGGNSGFVIFSYDPVSSNYTSLKSFVGTNGASPSGSLMQASDGKLYGMTIGGGNYGYGEIFSFDITTATFTKLQDFNKANGAYPAGTLIELNGTLNKTSASTTGKSNENSDRSSGKTENKLDLLNRDAFELTVTPNPVMNSTYISFTIQQQQHASLKIFDAHGEMIKVLADQKFEKGQYQFQWNTEGFGAGIYFLRFEGVAFSETKKLSVIK